MFSDAIKTHITLKSGWCLVVYGIYHMMFDRLQNVQMNFRLSDADAFEMTHGTIWNEWHGERVSYTGEDERVCFCEPNKNCYVCYG